ncbi:hypothetical protein V5O48_018900, partial [Marasmius crinis-equi]
VLVRGLCQSSFGPPVAKETIFKNLIKGQLGGGREDKLIRILPKRRGRGYNMRRAVGLIVDMGTFFEIGATWRRNIITGLARMGGKTVGVIANNCMVNGGAIDTFGSQKTACF